LIDVVGVNQIIIHVYPNSKKSKGKSKFYQILKNQKIRYQSTSLFDFLPERVFIKSDFLDS